MHCTFNMNNIVNHKKIKLNEMTETNRWWSKLDKEKRGALGSILQDLIDWFNLEP